MSTSEDKDKGGDDDDAHLYSLNRYWDNSDDNILTCPFDPSHRVRRFRIEHHLHVCRKNNPDVKVATCPYNATHVLPILRFVDHVVGCPDVRLVDPDQGLVRADWMSKPRMFKACLGVNSSMSDFNYSGMLTVPFSRIPEAKPADGRSTGAENRDEGPARVPKHGGEFTNPNDKRVEVINLKEQMRVNFINYNEPGGLAFVENNVIVGGVPSLISCGGECPEPSEGCDQEANNDLQPKEENNHGDGLTSLRRITARYRARSSMRPDSAASTSSVQTV